ncbi:MAG: bifunctional ADP-dependent NAD(P)H-hydrate dehydratase/NAD(P)H-hydrate epimerase, partial [Lentisphaerae bacterium]|nr:bifunctional ADP-dependent NAD(P)H-hydrate dehydratase/NAD(P)H-hydrate epimerase [Lentisphaerota bacterium]
MKVVSIAQMRELDRQTISAGVPAATLMDRAGEGLARIVADLCQRRGQSGAAILLLAGRGNNGGAALAAARHLLAL